VYPEFCPQGAVGVEPNLNMRTVAFMDVGDGGLFWAAGCMVGRCRLTLSNLRRKRLDQYS
jgi:hypothetical protein